MFVVKDYQRKIKMNCETRESVLMAVITFSGLFGSLKKDIRIESCQTGEEMTFDNFCKSK